MLFITLELYIKVKNNTEPLLKGNRGVEVSIIRTLLYSIWAISSFSSLNYLFLFNKNTEIRSYLCVTTCIFQTYFYVYLFLFDDLLVIRKWSPTLDECLKIENNFYLTNTINKKYNKLNSTDFVQCKCVKKISLCLILFYCSPALGVALLVFYILISDYRHETSKKCKISLFWIK